MSRKRVVAGLLILASGAVVADELTDLVPAETGAAACWQRIYDAPHLAAHPDQQVAAMTLSLNFAAYDDTDPGMHYFGMDVTLRDGRRGETGGACRTNDDGRVNCGVECDGGGVQIRLRPDGSLLADLEAYGFIRVEGECASSGEGSSFSLEPGLDDKQFLLHPADGKLCKGLLTQW